MGKRIHRVRDVSETESRELRTLANSRTEPHRIVQRAQLIVNMIVQLPPMFRQLCTKIKV